MRTERKFKLPATFAYYTRSTLFVTLIKHLFPLTPTQPLSWRQKLHLAIMPMLIPLIVVLVLLTYIPGFSLWPPDLVMGKE